MSTLIRFDSIDSTNEEAKRLFKANQVPPEGVFIVADVQTQGRGSKGRVWHSMDKGGLYFTYVFSPAVTLEEAQAWTKKVALVAAQCLNALSQLSVDVEWPNDLILEGRKVGGVLIETVSSAGRIQAVIVGIGMNLNQQQFPSPITHSAVSLAQVSGKEYDKNALIELLMKELPNVLKRN